MLRAVHSAAGEPTLSFNLFDLASDSDDGRTVRVGREADNAIRLDSSAVPYLLSRHHATIEFKIDGTVVLTDLASTNSTYISRNGGTLKRLKPARGGVEGDGQMATHVLEATDLIGFGGPNTIIAEDGSPVPNPFLFQYRPRIEYEPPPTPITPTNLVPAVGGRPAVDFGADQQVAGAAMVELKKVLFPPPPPPRPLLGRGAARGGAAPATTTVPQSPAAAVRRGAAAARDAAAAAAASAAVPPVAAPSAAATAAAAACSASVSDIVATHLACPICQDWLLASHMLPCGHLFCGLCLAKWLAVATRQSCPSCRKPVSSLPVHCFPVDNAIADLLGARAEIMSPGGRMDRRRKSRHWERIQDSVQQDWQVVLQPKKVARTMRMPPGLGPVPAVLVGGMVEPRRGPHAAAHRAAAVAAAAAAVPAAVIVVATPVPAPSSPL